ncbi:MFS transporter [Pseudonocardia alaniniphila]|uniref:MFS transporter n=1 Tax=Pseudonocardia alaniniphila TaxID=75291 RepID=A0ABS9TU87_9PSEU|nr:MFS transporter [Pseudonocardia alaniniphila]MCH6172057.1 MFS transporter [Pseudonocardia alaniniphila]
MIGQSRKGAFPLLGVVQITLIAAITMLAVASPSLQRDFALSAGDLALLNCAYGLSFSGLLLLGGNLADQLPRRRCLLIALGVFILGSLVVAASPNLVVLLVGRLVEGAGAALAAPTALALVETIFPQPARRSAAVALWGTLAAFGATAGTLVGGLTSGFGSWRWMFVGSALVMAGVAALVPRLLPNDVPPTQAARLGLPGTVLTLVGIGGLTYGLVQAPEHSWTAPQVLLALAVGVIALVGFSAHEIWSPRPLVRWPMFSSPAQMAGLVLILATSASTTAVFYFFSLYLQQLRGYSPLSTTAAFLPIGLVLVLVGARVGRLLGRWGAGKVLPVGAAFTGLGLLVLSRVDLDAPYIGLPLIGLVLVPAGASLSFAGATVAAVRGVDTSDAGLAGGVVNLAMETGPVIGLAVLVSISGARSTALLGHTNPAEAAVAGQGLAFAVWGAVMVIGAVIAAVALSRAAPVAAPFHE